jgi:hypothetical protein
MSEVESTIEVVRPTVKMEVEPASLPLPLQVIVRAVQGIANKVADGADLEVVRSELAIEARTLKCKLTLEYDKESRVLKIAWDKYGKDRFFVKRASVRCDIETAKDIIHYVDLMICDAVDTLTVKIPDSLLEIFKIFNVKAEAQTA